MTQPRAEHPIQEAAPLQISTYSLEHLPKDFYFQFGPLFELTLSMMFLICIVYLFQLAVIEVSPYPSISVDLRENGFSL